MPCGETDPYASCAQFVTAFIRRTRRLPIKGKVPVRVGQSVKAAA